MKQDDPADENRRIACRLRHQHQRHRAEHRANATHTREHADPLRFEVERVLADDGDETEKWPIEDVEDRGNGKDA